MQSHHFGGQSAIGSPAHVDPPRLPAAASSSAVEADRFRLHNAITRAWHRRDAAKKKADVVAYEGADDDLNRLCNQLARLPVVGRVPSREA